MDPIIQGIISSVIANCLTGLAQYLAGVRETPATSKSMELSTLIEKASDEVSNTIEWEPPPRVEEVCLFLRSSEVKSITRQILSSQILGNGNRNNLKIIAREFLSLFALWVGENEGRVKDAATILFQTLLKGCEAELNCAIDKGILAAHEAKSSIRYHILLDELETMQKNMSFLSANRTMGIKEVLEFEQKYCQQICNRHQHIVPPHFDTARKIPIDDIYVLPNFEKRLKKQEEKKIIQTEMELLSNTYRSVILGDPGSGKSTFALKLCHDLSAGKIESCFCGRRVTPILIILRDYGAEKRAHGCSILRYIEGVASSRYQLEAPKGAFEYLLLNGRTMVIFDGLDELLDTSYRMEISNDIESFCTLYPSIPVIVTSRKVGYEQAPLDEKRFEVFYLMEFTEDQVTEYVKKWFALDPDLTASQIKEKANSFLNESKIVPDLRSNPLMLALMCNIYRGENYIPRNRPDVYEKCATMLFERWDLSRGISVPLPFEAHIKPAMMYLAHWIYSTETLQGGVTEDNLVNEASKYLLARRFEDPDQAKVAARSFIDFCRGRAWVFTDTGTTKEGDRLYQFTHHTFLEYFTASHLVRTHSTAKTLYEVLIPRIIKREWDVVTQLSFQILNKNVEGAGDELLKSILKQVDGENIDERQRWNLLSFAARCLAFLVPSPAVTRNITKACINKSVDIGCSLAQKQRVKETVADLRQSLSEQLTTSLLDAVLENYPIIHDECVRTIVEIAKNDIEVRSIAALELGLFIPHNPLGPQKKLTITEIVYEQCVEIINKLRRKDYSICFQSFFNGDTTITEVIEWHKIRVFFTDMPLLTLPNMYLIPIYALLVREILYVGQKLWGRTTIFNLDNTLAELGHIFMKFKPPWCKVKHLEFATRVILPRFEKEEHKEAQEIKVTEKSLFGSFVLLAILIETNEEWRKDLIENINNIQQGLLSRLELTFRSRFEVVNKDDVRQEIKACGFDPQQSDLVWRWSQNKVNFTNK